MDYIFILGKDHRDCKAKFENMEKENGIRYTYATKPKHISNRIPFVDYILTDSFMENPYHDQMLTKLKSRGKTKRTVLPEKEDEDKQQLQIDFDQPQENVNIPVDDSDNAEQDNLDKDTVEVDDTEEETSIMGVLDELEKYKVDEAENDTIEETNNPGYLDQYDINIDENGEVINESTNPNDGEDVEEQGINVEDIKPVGDTPRGWHARTEFIDEEGNIFHKGTYVGNVKNNDVEDE